MQDTKNDQVHTESAVQLDDSNDPHPHLTAITQVLGVTKGPVSEVLMEMRRAALETPAKIEFENILVAGIQESVCQLASKVIRHFCEDVSMDKIHMWAKVWLEGDRQYRGDDAESNNSADAHNDIISPHIDELTRRLDEATELIAHCHRFLAALQAPGPHSIGQIAVQELPLFVDVLSLTAQYVDLENVYLLMNLHDAISKKTPTPVNDNEVCGL